MPKWKKPIEERFLEKVFKTHSCWIWTGATSSTGYGQFRDGDKMVGAHVWSYRRFVGPIPEGMQIDHVVAKGCVSKACVNPDHLEPVTRKVNAERYVATITHCPHGHEYTAANSYFDKNGFRQCRTCLRDRMRSRRRVTQMQQQGE